MWQCKIMLIAHLIHIHSFIFPHVWNTSGVRAQKEGCRGEQTWLLPSKRPQSGGGGHIHAATSRRASQILGELRLLWGRWHCSLWLFERDLQWPFHAWSGFYSTMHLLFSQCIRFLGLPLPNYSHTKLPNLAIWASGWLKATEIYSHGSGF